MNCETESDTETYITDERAARREKILNRIYFGYNVFNFIVTFGVYVFTMIIAVPVLKTCYNVAVIVMILGTVLGLIQLVPEFLRNFIKLEPKPARYVNYFLVFIVTVRTIWLISSTVIVADSQCDNINFAWISIYVNWGIFVSTAAIICIVVIVNRLKASRQQTRL